MNELTHILIATDGSPDAAAAATIGGEIARTFGSSVTLVHVASPYVNHAYGLYPQPAIATTAILEAAEETLALGAKPLAELGIDFDELVLRGSPPDEILTFAENEGVDLIVVGRRGLGALGRFFLGSVSNKIVHKAKRAVLVAPVAQE